LYNLEYVVDFPTSVDAQSATSVDNIFLDKSRNKDYVIEPYYNGLSDHDALILTLRISLYKVPKSRRVRIGRVYDDSSIREFKLNLSLENWGNVFDVENEMMLM
jgi:hypothetical protein